jgi:signal recognition particle receptor subunit beta
MFQFGSMAACFAPFRTKDGTSELLVVGLSQSGKSSYLRKLNLGEISTTNVCVGMNVENLWHLGGKVHFTAFSLSGSDKPRPLWRHFFQKLHLKGIIFVLDSTNTRELDEACNEALSHANVPIAFFANKQDSDKAMSVSAIRERLLGFVPKYTYNGKESACSSCCKSASGYCKVDL